MSYKFTFNPIILLFNPINYLFNILYKGVLNI